jgi:hypothetical protein
MNVPYNFVGSTEILARQSPYRRNVELHVILKPLHHPEDPKAPWYTLEQDTSDNSGLVYKFKELPFDDMFPAPSLHLDLSAAQQLMDELWQCGLRPTEGTGSAGAFAAQGKHLEDMRKLVFEHLDGDKA